MFMSKNSKFFKKLLTIALAMFVMAGSVQGAYAVTRKTSNSLGVKIIGVVGGGLNAFADGDDIEVAKDNTTIQSNGDHLIASFDLDGATNSVFTIGMHDVTVSEIKTPGAVGMTVNIAQKLILDGANVYAGLAATNGGLVEITGAGHESDAAITSNVEIAEDATLNGAVVGDVKFTGAKELKMNNDITGNLDYNNTASILTLGAGRKITGDVNDTGGNAGILKFVGGW